MLKTTLLLLPQTLKIIQKEDECEKMETKNMPMVCTTEPMILSLTGDVCSVSRLAMHPWEQVSWVELHACRAAAWVLEAAGWRALWARVPRRADGKPHRQAPLCQVCRKVPEGYVPSPVGCFLTLKRVQTTERTNEISWTELNLLCTKWTEMEWTALIAVQFSSVCSICTCLNRWVSEWVSE